MLVLDDNQKATLKTCARSFREPTKSEKSTVTWRRSAPSSGETLLVQLISFGAN